MTVAELIKALGAFDDDLPVEFSDGGISWPVDGFWYDDIDDKLIINDGTW